MTFAVGSLVRARGREWVVLPESAQHKDLLVLRPLVGTEDEVTGVYLPLEPVESTQFPLPDPAKDLGNHRSCSLLRDAIRLGFRNGAGPFRSLARIAVEPRPYQIVPLLMALKLDPVRLLIADDVGVGKTIETCLIVRELLDRGEIRRSAVLCPPHLAEQWQRALEQKFHIEAVTVLPGTAGRLERAAGLGPAESLFDHYPHMVVSMDYINSERRRHEFLRACPELVVVDEAHTCTFGGVGRSSQQRHELLRQLLADGNRHAILVTATPHSGKEETFRSLLALLDPVLAELPADLAGDGNRAHRERLARHFVQRRRGDLKNFLGAQTPFPERDLAEDHYSLTPDYRQFFDRVLAYCREQVLDQSLDRRRQRVRWWSALALLRSLSSSPAAAAATLRNRSSAAKADTVEEADDLGSRTVLDPEGEAVEGLDVVPGSEADETDAEGAQASTTPSRDRLLRFAREVEQLAGAKDAKLQRIQELVRKLLAEGCSPILFCRFIPTVEYVADALRRKLGANVEVAAVTGDLPPEEREDRIAKLASHPQRVLVCTDCLSEGIDLQYDFDAVIHYDLSWNPTRHEQREGRVDRYDQRKPRVRTLTFYGKDNPVDGMVLRVLLRKHKTIHDSLGITVPVPMDTNVVIEAMFEALLLKEKGGSGQLSFDFIEEQQRRVDLQWDTAVEREKKSRTVFAQHSIKVDEVAQELEASRFALGDDRTVESFTLEALRGLGASVSGQDRRTIRLDSTPPALRDALLALGDPFEGGRTSPSLAASGTGPSLAGVVFRPPAPLRGLLVTRTHPLVAATAEEVWKMALDPLGSGPARRCGVVRTRAVTRRTTLLLLRLRFHLIAPGRDGVEQPLFRDERVPHPPGRAGVRPQLAEEAALAGFAGSPEQPEWLAEAGLEPLLAAAPDANTLPEAAVEQLRRILDRFEPLRPHLEEVARERGRHLLEAHQRVRRATSVALRGLRVEPHLPVDVLGLFLFLPFARDQGGERAPEPGTAAGAGGPQ